MTPMPTQRFDAARPAHRRASAALAVVAGGGALLQLVLSLQTALQNGKTLADGVVIYLGYFTVLTNLLVAWVAAAQARAGSGGPAFWRGAAMRGCAVSAIVLVGIVYHLLLRELWSPQGWQWLADMLLHYAVPLAALALWIVLPPAERMPPWLPLAWCGYPVAYFVYAMARGAVIGSYPYPFIDAAQLGYAAALRNAAAMAAAFAALAYGVWAVARPWRAFAAPPSPMEQM